MFEHLNTNCQTAQKLWNLKGGMYYVKKDCQDVIVMNMLMLMHSIVQYDMFQRTLDILLLIIKIYYSSFNFMESKDQ